MASSEVGTSRWETLKNVESMEFEFDWTIDSLLEFEILPGEQLHSPYFGGLTKFGRVECEIFAFVYPRGVDEARKGYLFAYLGLEVDPAYKVMAQYKVSILAVDGQKLHTKTIELKEFKSSWGVQLLLLNKIENRQDKYLPSGNLTLHYEGKVWITLDSSEENDMPVKPSPKSNSSVHTMITKHFFETGNNSDVTIKAGSREFKCHKCVLSIRSEYFRAMFESGMKESQEGVVDFSDQMDGDVLEGLLEYLYLGMASNLEKTCQKMLKIADMFQLDDLKSQSEEELIEHLSPNNAWDLAVLAREHGAKKLLKKAISFLDKCL